MKVFLNEINGLWAAVNTMYFSRGSWSREKEQKIMRLYAESYDRWGKLLPGGMDGEFEEMVQKLFKWAPQHITMARFIDFTFTVEGLHRGAQDDFDSHAKRMDNRIIRFSTRLAKRVGGKSEWYEGKILTTDEALAIMDINAPQELMVDGRNYVRTDGGYILEEHVGDKDVQRGLYTLSIPSNFTFKINATEFAHVLKERDIHSHAAPELKICVEDMLSQINREIPQYTREWCYSVRN